MWPFILTLIMWAQSWITYEDTGHLARLCWVETRGMGEARETACASVVSTVLTRAYYGILSDGTIEGTITWGCGPDTLACQFPGFVVNGCQGIRSNEPCPFDDPVGVERFRIVVIQYLTGQAHAECEGYVFYSARHYVPDCQIQGNGQITNYHGRP